MAKKLISLEENNKHALEVLKHFYEGTPNGVACPECGAELHDMNENSLRMSLPAQVDTRCHACRYRGTRFI